MKKLLFLAAACAVFVVGCAEKSAEDGGATKGSTAEATTGATKDSTTGATAENNATTGTEAAPGAAGGAGFASVQPVFNSKCVGCHGGGRPKGGINLTSYENVMRGGEEGPVVTPGDPENSVMVQALHGTHGKKHMPPGNDLPADQIKAIEDWIKDGAKS